METQAMEISVNGSKFFVSTAPHRQKYWTWVSKGQWEPSTFEAIRRFTRAGEPYIDIGTWIGPTVLYAASRGARVTGFEPDPAALDELRANLAANDPEFQRRVRIEPVAISTEAGTRTLYANEFGDSMSRFDPNWQKGGKVVRLEQTTACQTISAADAAEKFTFHAASMIKIDVEGHEYEFMPAMTDFFARHAIPVHLSLHPTSIGNSLTTSEATKSYRIEKTTRVLDVFKEYDIHLCEPKTIVPIGRREIDALLRKSGCVFGPLLLIPQA